jgi:imidazoleglycerol phosphate dehydratase HisB
MSLHIRQDAGHNHHHIIEAAFKALAYALKEAFTPKLHITSTKGTL